MNRPLFAYERLMLAGGRPYTVMLAARVHTQINQLQIEAALSWLQQRHPALRSAIVREAARDHFVLLDPAPPVPIDVRPQTGDDWFDTMCQQLDRPLPRATGPLARLVWRRSDAFSELILVVDHVICDGRSVAILMRELLGRIARPEHDPVPPAEFHTLNELFGPVSRAVRLSEHALATVLRPILWARKWRARSSPAKEASYVLHWEMDAVASASLTARAQVERVTPYAALATAFLRAITAARPQTALNRLASPIDLRPFFAVRSANMLFPTPGHVALSLPRGEPDFWPQARHLASKLLRTYVRTRPDRMARLIERLASHVDGLVDQALSGRPGNDLALSHLGEVDLSTPSQDAEALAQLASLPWSEASAVMSLTAAGRLRFCLISRPGVLPRAEAEQIRDHAMALLASST